MQWSQSDGTVVQGALRTQEVWWEFFQGNCEFGGKLGV